MTLSRYQLWYGRNAAPPQPLALRAGPLTALLVEADLRRVRIGGVEVAQRIYVAVRDEVWNTIPATYSDLHAEIADDHFSVRFVAHHQYQDIDFTWQGHLSGTPDGVITYAMDGVAGNNFRYCKIGFNIHHPLHGSVGRPYRAHTPSGMVSGVLPMLIDPQRVLDGRLTGMFAPYDAIEIAVEEGKSAPSDDPGLLVPNGLTARFQFEGDLFELQDHRNWTDGNFKSYGTPLSVPYPMDIQAGRQLRQQVTISAAGTPSLPSSAGTPRIALGPSTGRTLPPIGTAMAGHGRELSAREVGLLRALRLDHLRVDLFPDDAGWQDALQRAVIACKAIGAGLELALHVSDDSAAHLAECAALIQSSSVAIARVLVFAAAKGRSTTSGSTPAPLVRLVRERLRSAAPGAVFAGGTTLFFAEINRDAPDVSAMDAVVYSINPQVHACDDTSLVENLEDQAETIISARALCDNRPVVISPITFIGRNGPYAAGPPQPGDLPGNIDVRQASLFGAGWTVGSVKYLAGIGAASLTYYETTGWLGLMETEDGSPMPGRFPSQPATVFPLYHVFADLAEWKGGELLELHTSDPLSIDGLAIRHGGAVHAIVANLTYTPQVVTMAPLAGERVRVRRLDEESALQALTAPEQFRAAHVTESLTDGELRLILAPFAVARIEEEVGP